MKSLAKGIYLLKGALQHYAWGGNYFIATLLNLKERTNKPIAEFWLGIHKRGEAKIEVDGSWQLLSDFVKVPYLFKILDVQNMLSIQSHPNKKQAAIGFANEEAKGIAIDAKNRVFKDDNHKPELMVALSDFWLLHGFQSIESIRKIINKTAEFKLLFDKATSIEAFYTYLMRLSNEAIEAILKPLKERLTKENPSDKNYPDYWAMKAFNDYGYDKGIFSLYFYNLVYLKKGEAIYQEAGIPHAYLEGQNVEIMANSDNVFRAGLTPKHIDIDLLLNHLSFEAVMPTIIRATSINKHESVYKSVAQEFELQWIELAEESIKNQASTNEVYFVLEGKAIVKAGENKIELDKGESIFCNFEGEMLIKSKQNATIVKATIPSN